MTPSELVRYAAKKGLAAVAITDHDTIDGIEEAVNEGQRTGIEVIPGIEISVEYDGEMHILGYYINKECQVLNKTLQKLKEFRNNRNQKMVKRLNSLGFPITMEELLLKAKGKVVGRPHVASVMKDKGYVSSTHEAFEKYLAVGKPAYVSRERLTPKEGIELIKEAGGIPVLAHPVYLGKEGDEFDKLLKNLIHLGLEGIEGYYSTYSVEIQNYYLEVAARNGLLVTGGSDFHGANKPDIDLGTGWGSLKVPYELLEQLKDRRS